MKARQIVVAAALAGVVLAALSGFDRDTRASPGGAQGVRAPAGRAHQRATRQRRPSAVVAWPRSSRASRVPRSFLGFSTEYWTLPLYERHLGLLERALALIHVPGNGPEVLRIGGDSADHAFWDPRMHRMPRWAFRVGPSWLRFAGRLVRRGGLRLILDLNLVTGSSPTAARWARAADRYLPRGSIIGFEIGNEPDIYSRWDWLQQIGRAQAGPPLLPRRLSPATYLADFRAYARALSRVAPHVPLAGPALANPAIDLNWLAGLITGAHPELGLLSAHRYPYSACVRRGSRAYPSIARLLSETASAGVARSVLGAVRLARRARLPFRLTELNSVTCSGVTGLSNSFATALWAPDVLFELMRAGVDGVNVHVREYAINGAFGLGPAGLEARPLMYGLILFTRTLGSRARLVPLHVSAPASIRLKAWGVELPRGRLRILLIDKGQRAAHVTVRLPPAGAGTLERLLAPTVRATSGVTLAGQRLDASGHWRGAFAGVRVPRVAGGYRVLLPETSAALLSVTSRRAASPSAG